MNAHARLKFVNVVVRNDNSEYWPGFGWVERRVLER